jgi:hypothetical protein
MVISPQQEPAIKAQQGEQTPGQILDPHDKR